MNSRALASRRQWCRASCFFNGVLLLLLIALRAEAFIDVTLQMQLGNPSGAGVDTNNYNHYLVQRSVEAFDYSANLGEPVWASWDLTISDVGTNARSSTFFPDTNLPPNFYRVTTADYNGVGNIGFNRGHLCPSEDRTDTREDNDAVFYMSNIMPQSGANNSGPWGTFEGYCRSLAATNELLITCGPSGFGTNTIPSGKVYMPSNAWKVVVVVPSGNGTALSRTTASNRVICISIPNATNGLSSWPAYITTASQIENDTGLTFFTALPPPIASAFRYKMDGVTNPPPAIFAFSPATGTVNTNVVISGTNFGPVLAVTFNGASAAFTVNSNNQITATVPANATSGLIAVTTASGTANSSGSFTVIGSTAVDLSVAVSHTGDFTQGDAADTYTIIVTNIGALSGTGTVSVMDVLPTGLSATSMSGGGWSANLSTLTCTRSDSLAPGASYPPITVTVSVAANAPGLVNNSVTVSGGGDPSPNTASDPTVINSSGSIGGTFAGVLAGWDVSGQTNYGVSPLSPSTNAPHLTITGLTRGAGVLINNGGLAHGGWGGLAFTNVNAANAASSNQFATFSVKADPGYKVTFSSFERFDYRRSSTGPATGVLQYQIGSAAFSDITNLSYSSSASSGASIGAIDLSGFAALQNIGPNTNVTFRIVNYGGSSSSGTWYIFDVANSSVADLTIQGTVTALAVATNPPAIAPSFTLLNFTNNQFQFTVNGTAGSNYILQASTDLIATNWISLATNAAPFVFVESNANLFGRRFYRAFVKP